MIPRRRRRRRRLGYPFVALLGGGWEINGADPFVDAREK